MEEQANIVECLRPDRARLNITRLLNVCPTARATTSPVATQRHRRNWTQPIMNTGPPTRLPTYLPIDLPTRRTYLLAELPYTPTDLPTELPPDSTTGVLILGVFPTSSAIILANGSTVLEPAILN